MQPFEVSYTTTGRKKARNVIGVLCPTVIAQRLGSARPIFVALGDVVVDWNAPKSEGYLAMFDTPTDEFTGALQRVLWNDGLGGWPSCNSRHEQRNENGHPRRTQN